VHHFNGATMGWIITAGQVLTGARDEARAEGGMPMSLLDGSRLAHLAEEHSVGVVQSSFPISVPDVDLFEALRSS
jgi:restriction endonuclease Mrr